MRARLLVVVCALALAACGAPGGLGGPPSARTVAASDSDWPGLHRCSESGTYESYMQAEKSKFPAQFQTDKTSWDQLKGEGANDSYIAVYAGSTSNCAQFGSGSPASNVAYVYAIRFKDTAAASSSFKTSQNGFHVSDSDVASVRAAGGTVQQGAATGLGDNSITLSIDLASASVFVAFWQRKQFRVAVVTFHTPTLNSSAATKKIDARIT